MLAATLVPIYGIYSGYELVENVPASEHNTEYLDSEKYQIKERDWSDPPLAPLIRTVNEVRRRHPDVWALRDVRFHHSDNEQLLVYSRGHVARDLLLVVVNLDPHHAQVLRGRTGEPALRVRRTVRSVAGRPVEHFDAVYRGDMFEYSLEFEHA